MAERTKICLLGDSQAGALKHGWKLIQNELPQIDLTFFAGANAEWETVRAVDGRLVPASPKLREQFDRSAGTEEIADSFDAYMLCGLGLAISYPLRLWTHHQQPDWNTYRSAVITAMKDTLCARVLAKLRAITTRPIVVVVSPFQPHDYCKSSPLLDTETAARLRAVFDETCEALAAAHSATCLFQPEETLAPNRVTTRMEFANPPTDGQQDRRHCNAAYGAIVLRNALEECSRLAAKSRESVT